MGLDFSKDENSYLKNGRAMASYAPSKEQCVDPIPIMIKYLNKKNIVETKNEEMKTLLIENEDENAMYGFLSIIKYIGKTNFLYCNKNYMDCAKIDIWIEKCIKINTVLEFYKKSKISEKDYLDFLKEEFQNFSDSGFRSSFIEYFNSPTIADFSWYSFFMFCKNDETLVKLMNDYPNIEEYIMYVHEYIYETIKNQEDEDDEEDEEDEEDEDEDGEPFIKKEI